MSRPIDRLVRSSLAGYAPYVPGTSADDVRRRYPGLQIVKLSQNENPLGSSPLALAALAGVEAYNDYVEDEYAELRGRLGDVYGFGLDRVLMGHGSNEILMLLFQTFVDPGDEVVMATPSFSLFKKDAIVAGALAVEVPLRDGVHDLDAMLRAVSPRTKLVFVCDPNNPTGTRVERAALERFAAALPQHVLLVLDQAYFEYMDAGRCDGVDILRSRPATIVLRTFSKVYGLAALRFGYAYGSADAISWLWRVRLPFNVSRSAAVAAAAALDDRDFVARSVFVNEEGKRYFAAEFARLGLFAYPTAANFVAVAVPVPAEEAYAALLRRGVIVRSGHSLGMPKFLRVTIGTPHENQAFVRELEALLEQWRAALPAGAAR